MLLIYVGYFDISESKGKSINEREVLRCLVETKGCDFIFLGPRPQGRVANEIFDRAIFLDLKVSQYSQLRFQLWLFINIFRLSLKNKNNVVICCRPHYFSISPVLIKKILNVPLISKESGLAIELLKKRRGFSKTLKKIAIWTRTFNANNANLLWCVTKQIGKYWMTKYGVSENKIFVQSNGANIKMFHPEVSPRLPSGVLLKRKCKYYALYAGELRFSGVIPMIKAVALLRRIEKIDIGIIIAGDGEELGQIKATIKQEGVDDVVTLLGSRPYEEMPALYAYCDVLVGLFSSDFLNNFGSSCQKIFQYISMGKPVLAGYCEDHLFLEKEKLGHLVQPEDILEIADGIKLCIDDIPDYNKNKKKGFKYIKDNRSYEAIARNLVLKANNLLMDANLKGEKC